MTNQDIEKTVQLEDSSHLSIKDSTCLRTGLTLNVNTLIIQFYITKSFYGILSIAAGNNIGSCNRHWQLATVANKATGEFPVCLIHHIGFKRRRFLCCSLFGRRSCRRFRFFGSSFFTGSSFLTGFFSCTFTGFLYFFGYQTIDTCIQLVSFLTLFIEFILQTALFLLQVGHQSLLFLFLSFQLFFFYFTLFQ